MINNEFKMFVVVNLVFKKVIVKVVVISGLKVDNILVMVGEM